MHKDYLIPIIPLAWSRAGINTTHGSPHFFDHQHRDKIMWGLHISKCHGNSPLFCCPLSLDVTFFMAKPKKFAKGTFWHQNKPDCDNLLKFLLDSMVTVCIDDDRRISQIIAKKVYALDCDPHVQFSLTEL
jgi:Holliday junction resolvase RusA-like endonuclease